jgi:hypothetical protein
MSVEQMILKSFEFILYIKGTTQMGDWLFKTAVLSTKVIGSKQLTE